MREEEVAAGLAIAILVALASLAAPVASAQAAVVYSPDRVIVQWAPGASPAERRAARADADVEFERDLGDRRFQLVETKPGQAPGAAIRELAADPAVLLAERDGHASADAAPDDPLFGQLWGLRNTGVGIFGVSGAVPGADIDLLGAWTRTLGTPSTVVAVLDSGYRFEHPDLADAVWTNAGETPANGLDDDGNGVIDDVHGADFVGTYATVPEVDGDPTDDNLNSGGHGVHVAGTIAAAANNGVGIAGVAAGATIMPLRVCADLQHELECVFSSAIAAINYAGEMGAQVANLSFGSPKWSAAIGNAIAANPGTLFVASAGNEKGDNDGGSRRPCTVELANVVCVAATDQADQLASFSNWGARSVDLGAPGTETLSADNRHRLVEEDFELDDLAVKWNAVGADGGLARTSEAPLKSFGVSAWPGATPAANSVRAIRSDPVTVPPGFETCTFEFFRALAGSFQFELRLDEEPLVTEEPGPMAEMRRVGVALSESLKWGGEVDVRFQYTADASPKAGDGLWIDDVKLHCVAPVGQADGYSFRQGTSMAAPHVAGAAALAFSLKPSASVADVRQALLGSVDPLPALAGKTASGGRLDAAATLELFDAVPPPTPLLSATSPASPSTQRQPRVTGSAQPGTTVEVFANPACAGTPLASGSAAEFAGAGIAVTVGEGSTTQLWVRATDLAPLSSPCSTPLSYTHVKPPPDPEEGGGGPVPDPGNPPSDGPTPLPAPPVTPDPPTPLAAPACTVPKLAGKTLAQATAALRRSACALGVVRKPPQGKQKRRPLVVKSSTPRAGTQPAAGKVHLTLALKPRSQ